MSQQTKPNEGVFYKSLSTLEMLQIDKGHGKTEELTWVTGNTIKPNAGP